MQYRNRLYDTSFRIEETNAHAHIPIVVVWRLVDDPCARQPFRDYRIREYISKAPPSRQPFHPMTLRLETFASIWPYTLTAAFSPPYPFQMEYTQPDPANPWFFYARFRPFCGWPASLIIRHNISVSHDSSNRITE